MQKNFRWTLSLLPLLWSCGGGPQAKPRQAQPLNPQLNFGYVGRCLQKVSRLIDADGVRVVWQGSCSPIFENDDREGLKAELNAWREEHCAETLPLPQTRRDTLCKLLPGEYTRYHSSRESLAEAYQSDEDCGKTVTKDIEPGLNPYGYVGCETMTSGRY